MIVVFTRILYIAGHDKDPIDQYRTITNGLCPERTFDFALTPEA
jgi:hypothetical protein